MAGGSQPLPARGVLGADIDLSDIQGNVLRGYTSPAAAYILLRIHDAPQACALLRRSLPLVMTAETGTSHPSPRSTWPSRSARFEPSSVDEGTLASFPLVFREGMRARAQRLGDVGPSAPGLWHFDEAHVLVSVYAAEPGRLDATLTASRAAGRRRRGRAASTSRGPTSCSEGKDHFGFFDGASQPALKGSGVWRDPGTGCARARTAGATWPPGEVVLGYPDEDHTLPEAPAPPFDRNATYVVLRKLSVDAAAFRRFVAGADYPGGPELLAAKMVGRWPDGTPLALAPDQPDASVSRDPARINDFGYADDPQGLRCPPGSHIRRANPRDAEGFYERAAQPAAPDRPPGTGVRPASPAGGDGGRRSRPGPGVHQLPGQHLASVRDDPGAVDQRRRPVRSGAATPILLSASPTRGRTG